MLKRVNWNGVVAWGKAYQYTIVSIFALLLYLFLFPFLTKFGQYPLNILGIDLDLDRLLGYISILIGLGSVSLALWSIQSTTISLKDIQSDYWNVRGLDEEKKGNYHDAFKAFDKSTRIDPSSIKCLINKSNALCKKGKRYHDKSAIIDAIRVARQAIDKGPKYPPTWKSGTTEEFKAKQQYGNALKTECDALINQAELSPDSPYKDRLLDCALKDSEKAIQEYSWDPFVFSSEVPGAYTSKATVLSHMGKHDEAIKTCVEAIKLAPHEAPVWAINGNTHHIKAISLKKGGDTFHTKGLFVKAKDEYTRAADEYSSAIAAYDRAIELKPNYSDAWNNKGLALWNESTVLLKIIENSRETLMREGGKTYERALTCFNAAIYAFDKAIEFAPLDFEPREAKGDALLSQKCYDKAIEAYDGAIDINPLNQHVQEMRHKAIIARINDINNENKMGIEFLGDSMYSDALQSFDKVIKQDPSFKIAFCNKGYALYKLGKHDEALEAYFAALKLDPKYVIAWNGKGCALKALGRYAESDAAFSVANKIETSDRQRDRA